MNYFLAIDIGASSGRHILRSVQDNKLTLQEIYRFENSITEENGSLIWDMEKLTENVISGIAQCKKIGKLPKTVAIDSWGVDYALLDKNKKEISPVYAYRDSRTLSAPGEVAKLISPQNLFERTGIYPLNFNSIYQLYCDKTAGRLNDACYFMMIPDYLSYRLTGVMANEYTNATTTGLISAKTNDWDVELIELLGYKKELFMPLAKPATPLAEFSKELQNRVGFNATVIHAPSHDTASAVAACPIDNNSIYISSGTWSLIGTENQTPILNYSACQEGFSNEGGVEYRFRFLENIMGMWLMQSIKKNLNGAYSYDDLMKMAMKSSYNKLINPNDKSFLAPSNMIEAVRTYLNEKDLPLQDVLKSIYLSLAHSYDIAVKTVEKYSDKKIEKIIIVGGGSKDTYLNGLTAEITGKTVLTGLSEATAVGNLLSQIMWSEKLNLNSAREIVKNTFDIKETV